ncbi:MAG: hypothetical protein CHACPFDD_00302 [Phycisphaerae bacterium]|nr:hypothetical protein [Phycisphaerae bacterium]
MPAMGHSRNRTPAGSRAVVGEDEAGVVPADIRCLCLDVDGVLTDGRLFVDDDGRPLRAFDVQDGFALRWFQRSGGVVAIVTGKSSRGLVHRATELGIEHVVQGSEDKLRDLQRVLEATGIEPRQTAVLGDDLPDLPLLLSVGLPLAVANAVEEVRAAAQYVTIRTGGAGAVREVVELIMRASGRWEEVVEHYRRQGTDGRRDGGTEGRRVEGTEARREG